MPAAHAAPPDAQAKRSPLLAALQTELERSMKTLSALDPPAYYMGYTITERSEEHTSELQSRLHLVCRLLLEKKKKNIHNTKMTTSPHKARSMQSPTSRCLHAS